MKESFEHYKKTGNVWKKTYETIDCYEIHTRLMEELISKKLHKCQYIKSMKDKRNNDGTRTITVYYHDSVTGNNYKGIYIVKTNA